jgi:hypothetical protein
MAAFSRCAGAEGGRQGQMIQVHLVVVVVGTVVVVGLFGGRVVVVVVVTDFVVVVVVVVDLVVVVVVVDVGVVVETGWTGEVSWPGGIGSGTVAGSALTTVGFGGGTPLASPSMNKSAVIAPTSAPAANRLWPLWRVRTVSPSVPKPSDTCSRAVTLPSPIRVSHRPTHGGRQPSKNMVVRRPRST